VEQVASRVIPFGEQIAKMYNRRMPDATPTPTEEEAEAAALQLKNISNLRSADEEKERDLRESMPILCPLPQLH